MKKSNCREVRRAVEAYVLQELETINERGEYDGTFNYARPVSSAFNVLREEMDYQSYYGPASDRPVMGAGLAAKWDAAGSHDHYTAVTPYRVMWLYAAIGSLEPYTGDIRRLLAEWLDETHEEAARYSDTQAERQFCHMTAQAFERLYERENTPHRIPTADFRALYDKRNGGHFFDRETLRYYGQTMRSFAVYGFELVTDCDGTVHDCYSVNHTITAPSGEKFARVDYFDRETIAQVFPEEA